MPSRLAIIGAGPAGCMAALRAARAGHEVVVFEAGDRVGGMAASIDIGGQSVDLGSHRLHPATPAPLLAELRDLLGEELQTRPRNGRIRLGDRWVAFPLRPSDLIRNLPLAKTLRMGTETLGGARRNREPGNDFDAEVIRRFGPTVASDFYGPYARKLYGIDPALLDVELAQRRISAGSPIAIARAMLRGQRQRPTFLYPRTGYGTITERLAAAASDAGAQFILDSRVIALSIRSSEIELGLATPTANASTSTGSTVSGTSQRVTDLVLSTIPVTQLLSAIDPGPPPDIARSAANLRTRAMVLVYLVLHRSPFTPFDAHYLPGPGIVSRLSEPKNYRDNPDDPRDRTVLCAEVPCWRGDAIWKASDSDLDEQVTAELHQLSLPALGAHQVEVRRLPSVYPVYERATAEDRRAVDTWVRGLDRILSFGRQGLGVPDNIHHVLAMGDSAAGVVNDDASIDTLEWCRHLEQFASHVVED